MRGDSIPILHATRSGKMLHRCSRLLRPLTQPVICVSASSRLQHKTVYTCSVRIRQSGPSLRLMHAWTPQPSLVAYLSRSRPCIVGRTGSPWIKEYSRWFHQTATGRSGLSEAEVKKRKEEIVDKFFEARELLDDAVSH